MPDLLMNRRRRSDRREFELTPPQGVVDRRFRPERRYYSVSQANLLEWEEAVRNYYFHLPAIRPDVALLVSKAEFPVKNSH